MHDACATQNTYMQVWAHAAKRAGRKQADKRGVVRKGKGGTVAGGNILSDDWAIGYPTRHCGNGEACMHGQAWMAVSNE